MRDGVCQPSFMEKAMEEGFFMPGRFHSGRILPDVSMPGWRERTALSDTLSVLCGTGADNLAGFHFNSEMLPHKPDRGENGKIGVPFAASRTANLTDGLERLCGHLVGKREGFFGKRGRAGKDGDKDPRTDAGTAGAPVSAGASGYVFSAAHHFTQGRCQIHVAAGIGKGGQKRCADQNVMFRAVHMAEGLVHQFFKDGNRVF